MIPTGVPSRRDALRIRSAAVECSSRLPWDRFNRATLMPHAISAWILSSDAVDVPRVQIILVFGVLIIRVVPRPGEL